MQRVVDISRQWIVAAALLVIIGLLAVIMLEVFREDSTVDALPEELALPTLTTDAVETKEPTLNPEEIYANGGEQPILTEPNAAQEPAPAPLTHQVNVGDTLYEIALQYGTTIDAIVSLNRLANPNDLDVGQVLKIPTPVPTNN